MRSLRHNVRLKDITGQHATGGGHVSRTGRLHRGQGTNRKQADQPGRGIAHQVDELGHQHALLTGRLHQVDAVQEFRPLQNRVDNLRMRCGKTKVSPEEMSPEALHGGKYEKNETDTGRRSPHLLRSKRSRAVVAKCPHRESRSRLDTHESEHVGQNHDAGPGPTLRLNT